ncbi:MAG: hypothetical protein ACRD07_17315 [Acidimicrobiales bacterium]
MRVARSLAGLGAGFVAAGVAACGGSGYQFVQNDDLGVYAKLPGDWEVYDERDLFPEDSDSELERRREGMWVRTFDGSEDPSAEASTSPGDGDPTGIVQVRVLGPDEREQINLSALRGLGNPQADPVAAARANVPVQVFVDEPVEFDGGYHGVHTVFAVAPEEDGNDLVVTDRTVLLDAASTTMFVFQLACAEDCYLETHKDEIAEIVDSWTIQEEES